MVQSDPWAVIGQAGPGEPGPGLVLPGPTAASGAPGGRAPGSSHVAVAVLYFVSAALQAVWLATAPMNSPADLHVYSFPYQDANKGYVILLFIGVGTLVLVRRSRVFGLGLAVALPVHWLATNPGNFRPSMFTGSATFLAATVLFLCSELLVVSAAVPAVVALRRMLPARETPAELADRPGRRRVAVAWVCSGAALLGGGLWLAAGVLSWRVDHYGVVGFGDTHTYYCCNFDTVDSFYKAGAVGQCAVLLAFAVAAVFVRSTMLSAAWVLGPGLFSASQIPEVAARAVLPRESLFGWTWAGRFPDEWATTTLLPGFWCGVAGTAAVIGAAWLLIRIGRPDRDPIEVR